MARWSAVVRSRVEIEFLCAFTCGDSVCRKERCGAFAQRKEDREHSDTSVRARWIAVVRSRVEMQFLCALTCEDSFAEASAVVRLLRSRRTAEIFRQALWRAGALRCARAQRISFCVHLRVECRRRRCSALAQRKGIADFLRQVLSRARRRGALARRHSVSVCIYM